MASIGEVCRIESAREERPTLAEVVGFRDENLLLMPLGEIRDIHPGSEVVSTGGHLPVPIGDAIKGRVLDGLGNPLDNHGPLAVDHCIGEMRPSRRLKRKQSREVFQTGIKALDTFAPIGQGQRFGIFGGSGVGKSTLLEMIARQSDADVNVIALIGARGPEANEFLERDLTANARDKSVVIVAGADDPTLTRVKAASLATNIAEHFCESGKSVLLIIDSITRFAMAQREVGLAIGEGSAASGWTPSVLSAVPQIIERTGMSENGSITGLFSVLVEADDHDDPVSDSVRSMVDGQIVLTRELALQNHYPAIDLLASLSRHNRDLLDAEQLALVARAREALATYYKHQNLISIGAIPPGANPAIDHAIRCQIALQSFVRQNADESFGRDGSWKLLAEAFASAGKPPLQSRKASSRRKR